MDANNPAQVFLDEEIPVDLRHLIPSALRRAYANASRLMEREEMFKTPGGKFQRGDLIAVSAELELERLVTTNQLPFDRSWEPYAKPTGKHLVIWTQRGRLTVSQVEDAKKKPRPAEFRANYGLTNEPFLFDFMNEEVEKTQRKHMLLLHGYQELNFAHFTIPHAKWNYHLAKSPNLLALPHAVSDDLPAEEGPTDSPDPDAIDDLVKFIRDNGDE